VSYPRLEGEHADEPRIPDEWGSVKAAGPKKTCALLSQAFWPVHSKVAKMREGKSIFWKQKTTVTPRSTGLVFSADMQELAACR
jgi:hypothetical protein